MSDDVIIHFGVKGMKWGVTRPRGSNGRVDSSDHTQSRELMKKKPRELSTKELKSINDRLNTEKLNNELQSRSGLAKLKRGTAIAGTILAVGTTITTAYNFSQSQAGKAIIDGLKRAKNVTS